MIIVGAGGLGLEVLFVLMENGFNKDIFFFDTNPQKNGLLFEKYPITHEESSLKELIKKDSDFIVGIGHPRLRERMFNKFLSLDGTPTNVISKYAHLSPFLESFNGCIVEPGVGVSHGTHIGTGCAFHINCTIGHSVQLGKFVNIGPGANVVGPCIIEDYAYISVGAIVLPNIRIGKHAIISANVVANRDVADYELFEG
jgi:sugar O-acyltransferase (sialic acid O-acetyltransferase NeuD family)